jgi:enoyl-CoA hydratase
MADRELIVERDDKLLTVTLNRTANRNTLSLGLLEELESLAVEIRRDAAVRAVILGGAGDNFSAGLDLKDPALHAFLGAPAARRRELALLGQRMCQAWEDIEAVTIAAIEGFCVGGAVSLALACDFRIIGKSGFMRVPEIELGMNYSWGSIPRLIHLIGPARTKLMVLTAERVDADQGLAWGLVEEVVADGSARAAAGDLADRILAKPQMAVTMTKQAVNRTAFALDRTASFMDADQFVLTTYSGEYQNKISGPVNRDRKKT